MRDTLAEQLLAKVMGWAQEDVAKERSILQAMAWYKYDEYQQFSPGMRFVESLALWLDQFHTLEERQVAYEFVKRSVLFCSSAEMDHLVTIAYQDHIRPWLFECSAQRIGIEPWHVAKIARSREYRVLRRRSLFLGLSDGSHIDYFRRCNQSELTHEQIFQSHELGEGRVSSLLKKLEEDLVDAGEVLTEVGKEKFENIFLLDDFSASGMSYFWKDEDGKKKGKLFSFLKDISDKEKSVSRLVDISNSNVSIIFYIATEQAASYLRAVVDEMSSALNFKINLKVFVVYPLSPSIRILPTSHSICTIVDKYYDEVIHDKHMQVGGTSDSRYGFAGCGLPLVLNHNTPNNSLPILWSYEDTTIHGLFPRVRRHVTSRGNQ